MSFPLIRQSDEMDCGAVCLQMICKYYGKYLPIDELRDRCYTNASGTTLYALSEAAEYYGLKSSGFKCGVDAISKEAPLPVVALWNENHFVVIYRATKRYYYVADPAVGKIKYDRKEFSEEFLSKGESDGVILTLEVSQDFDKLESAPEPAGGAWSYFWHHLARYKIFLKQVLIAAAVSSVLSLILPVITQSIIDDGVVTGDYFLIKVLLISQLLIFLGKLSFDVLKNWIIIHWSYRINISVISDFLRSFLGLSASQLSRKTSADILQRIEDYQNVEEFLENTSVSLILSIITFLLFSLLLWFYNIGIFLIFLLGTILGVLWVIIFQKQRKILFYKMIGLMTRNKFKIIDMIEGLNELKMYNLERRKRWEWEDVQVKEYQYKFKTLRIEQIQEVGFQSINELKNILIVFFGAVAVMNGEITLGMLLAISFISGQLNSSLGFLPGVFHITQEAKVSLERLIAVTRSEDEAESHQVATPTGDIKIQDVSLTYTGHAYALDEITFTIPWGSTTAIVGSSGSGKTSVLKLLTKFVNPTQGTVTVSGIPLGQIDDQVWRKQLGVVSQDGYIFPDTVLSNIAISDDSPSLEQAIRCAKVANIHNEILDLPSGYNTRIGEEGHLMSKGQNQRILITRAIYRDPDYLFFDEATSALDTVNEKVIQKNLEKLYQNRTVLIIAHRLSTVRSADQVIVLNGGNIVEQGKHDDLVKMRGHYYQLVKDQLLLGE